jgi:hypothetical protein
MKTGILYTILFCVASAGFVGWRVHAVRPQDAPHFELVEDPSISHLNGCESVLGLAEQALLTEGTSSGSSLTILEIGDETTANEPWQLGRYSIPKSRKVIEGRTANARRQQDLLRDIWNKCQTVRRTTISPIFLGVKQAIADLRAQGCSQTSHCQVFVDSDLEENVEASIKKSLNRTVDEEFILPSPIENEGIKIAFCGLAVTTGRLVDSSSKGLRRAPARTPAREDRLREIWRSLFTQQAAVKFEPYCPKPSELGAYMTSRTPTKEKSQP